MLGALMYCSKIIMEVLPNVHLLGMFTMAYTVALRKKALVPIYVYVMLNGVFAGFSMWWIPYLYIWTILWGATMLLPRNMSPKVACVVYPIVCAFHGFLFGILYSPAQALMFGLNWQQTIAWIASGIPFDIIHGISNFVMGFLVFPLSKTLTRLLHRGA